MPGRGCIARSQAQYRSSQREPWVAAPGAPPFGRPASFRNADRFGVHHLAQEPMVGTSREDRGSVNPWSVCHASSTARGGDGSILTGGVRLRDGQHARCSPCRRFAGRCASRSGYPDWLRRGPSARDVEDGRLEELSVGDLAGQAGPCTAGRGSTRRRGLWGRGWGGCPLTSSGRVLLADESRPVPAWLRPPRDVDSCQRRDGAVVAAK